jgi:hypothetical protein
MLWIHRDRSAANCQVFVRIKTNKKNYLISGADLLAVNADGNMPYDICDDEPTLDLIESEMASRGITQEGIDERRGLTEKIMLDDMKLLKQRNYPLDVRVNDGSTYVSSISLILIYIENLIKIFSYTLQLQTGFMM